MLLILKFVVHPKTKTRRVCAISEDGKKVQIHISDTSVSLSFSEYEASTHLRNIGVYQSILCHIPEDLNLQQHQAENLKSRNNVV
jgi:hypothetical protein